MLETKLTPLMTQYFEVKSAHPDKIILFRMGDFYEMFHEDAVVAAPILQIALTSRNKKAQDETKMCGVPHHAIAGPINKLLRAGYKVAICDQVEDPKFAKGIVKRAVTRILSPGMVYDPESLEVYQSHYIFSRDEKSIAFLEPTTGEAFFYLLKDKKSVEQLISILAPKEEVVLSFEPQPLKASDGNLCVSHFPLRPEFLKEVKQRYSLLLGLKSEQECGSSETAWSLIAYAAFMQGLEILNTLKPFEERTLTAHLKMSSQVLRHLEVFETYKGELKGSLFFAVDRTKTSAGARLLKRFLTFPLANQTEIEKRLNRVEWWTQKMSEIKEVREVLASMGDIERRLGKLSHPNSGPRDLLALSQSLESGLKATVYSKEVKYPAELLVLADQLVLEINQTILEEPAVSARQGYLVKKGYTPELDELIELSGDVHARLNQMEALERASTGISSLKFKYNNVFGYFIEITKTHVQKIPSHYQRKQSLVNAERYTTEELSRLEEKILSAKTRRAELEYEIFETLRKKILSRSVELMRLAGEWAHLDVATSLAFLALEYNYVRPKFFETVSGGSLLLKGSRHPVIEQISNRFVANSLSLKSGECLLLTGPNMAGKSTLMRQVALSVLLAQAGSFVPAAEARLPIFEKIFTRIGASDFLTEGLSTFMVEMKETSEMLLEAGERSLVILDEVGRGTSTFDGMSLAQSILEYLVTKVRPMTLFATHYHELTDLDSKFPQIQNAHMSIYEKGSDLTFLHTLTPGPASKSYGIQVAELAGLPTAVTKRAAQILKQRELVRMAPQLSLFDSEALVQDSDENDKLKIKALEQIKELDLNQLSPLAALNKLDEIKKSLFS